LNPACVNNEPVHVENVVSVELSPSIVFIWIEPQKSDNVVKVNEEGTEVRINVAVFHSIRDKLLLKEGMNVFGDHNYEVKQEHINKVSSYNLRNDYVESKYDENCYVEDINLNYSW